MADSAHWILRQPNSVTGHTFIDDEVCTEHLGMSEADLEKYRVSKFVSLGDNVAAII